MNKHLLLPLLGLAIMSLFACKKNTAHTPACTLTSLTDSTTTVQAVTQFTYDAAGRLTTAVVTGQKGCKRTYQYINNQVVFTVTDTTPGIAMEVDTLTINTLGLATSQTTRFPSSGSSYTRTYSCDEAGNALNSVENEDGVKDTLIYNTVGGDLMYETHQGAATHKTDFSYYPAASIVYGDPTDFRQLLYYGAYYYKNKHMLHELYSPGISYKAYTYTYTADNRIAKANMRQWTNAATDTVMHTITYGYNCR